MDKRRGIKSYRTIDLTFFAVILIIFESIIIRVSRNTAFRYQPYTVSLAAPICTLVYMRWGYWGCIHASLSGLIYCLLNNGNQSFYLIYIFGNLFSLISVPLLSLLKHERVRTDKYLWIIYALSVQFLMHLGRMILSIILGYSLGEAFLFLTTDILSGIFSLFIVFISKRLDGIFEEQHHYLERLNSPELEEEEK